MVRIQEEMKRDALGAVHRVELEREDGSSREVVLRSLDGWVVCRPFARALARREQRALSACEARSPDLFERLPSLKEDERAALSRVPGVRAREIFLRPFFAGVPLHRADRLPLDFFDLLEAAVRELHAAGVCHNDLHKEQNVVVEPSGWPRLIDFQLASVHPTREGRRYRSRCRDDLRHVQKLRRRYTKDGRGPAEIGVVESERMRRRGLALLWRRTGKPLYLFLTRGVLGTKDGEDRRSSDGSWPRWDAKVGPRDLRRPGTLGGDGAASRRSARGSS